MTYRKLARGHALPFIHDAGRPADHRPPVPRTGLGDRGKLLWLIGASSSVAAHLATPWIVRYGGGGLAFLHAITGTTLTVTMSVLTLYPVVAMWRTKPSARTPPEA
jgi:hypothetical protein